MSRKVAGQAVTGERAPRVGYLLRTYPRFSQTFVVNEILELERQGLDVTILSLRRPDEGLFHESICRVKARAHYMPEATFELLRKTRSHYWRWLRRAPRALHRALECVFRHHGATLYDLVRATALLRWVKKQRIDHVHVHFGTDEATVALLAKILGDLSYSVTLHAFDIFRNNVNLRLLARKINESRFTVTVSEFNRRHMVAHLPGVNADRIRVNYNGIDLQRFRPGGRRRAAGLVFGVGRLIEKKGFVHLVQAVARLRAAGVPVRCKIAGEGREEQRLREEIQRHGLTSQVELTGSLRQDDVRELMQTASCCVLPCVAARDGNVDALPTVLLESLASGCPSVSTRLSGVPEIIEHGVSGLLVEPGDVAGLTEAIREILTDPALADRLAADGRSRAMERFDIRRNVVTMNAWLCAAAGFPAATSVASGVAEPSTVAGLAAASKA